MATTPTDLNCTASVVAYNESHTLMAACDQSSAVIGVWQRDGGSRRWAQEANWPAGEGAITTLAWAPSEFGTVLCGGTSNGLVRVWDDTKGRGWELRATLSESSRPVMDMAFAPAAQSSSPLLAVAYGDGTLRFFEASAPLAAESWELSSELRAAEGSCTCVSWRCPSPGVPPMLVAGGAGGAAVWLYRESLMRWEPCVRLGVEADGYSSSGAAVAAWAPTLGRPYELVAVGAGTRVVLWGLRGAADALEAERIAVLDHGHAVLQLGWNSFGHWLAASTEGGEVYMWRPDLAGEWLLVNKITGKAPHAAMSLE